MSNQSIIQSTGVLATEPARVVALATSIVASLITLLVALGIDISEEVTVAILGLIATAGPLVAGAIIRQRVYSPHTVKDLVATGIDTGARLARRAEDV